MQKRSVFVLTVSIGLLMAGVGAGTWRVEAVQAASEEKVDPKLLDALLATRTKIHDFAMKGAYSGGELNGSPSVDVLLQAKNSLLQAQLNLCKSKEQRASTYEKMLAEVQKWSKQKYVSFSEAKQLKITAFELELQIAIHKDK